MCERVVSERLKVYVKDWCVQGCVCDRVVCKRGVCKRDVCSRLCVKQVCGRKRSVLKSVCSRRCRQVPRLSRKTKVDVTKRHARHAKQRLMSPSATPATQNQGRCRQAPRLPRKATWMSASATPATHRAAAPRATNGDQARHQIQPSAISATPATQNQGRCRQGPCLARKIEG